MNAADRIRDALASTTDGNVGVMPGDLLALCQQAPERDAIAAGLIPLAKAAMPDSHPVRRMWVARGQLQHLVDLVAAPTT